MPCNLAESLRLLLVTDLRRAGDLPDLVARCVAGVAGGVTAVQLRWKDAGGQELLEALAVLQQAVPVPVFVNDRADVALAGRAAGVHLGEEDAPVEAIRRVAPAGFVIGASVGDVAEAAASTDADYWGIGPVRSTVTKPEAGAALGHAGVQELAARAGGRPVVIIGGVRPEDARWARETLGAGVAVSSGILGASDPEAAARRYRV